MDGKARRAIWGWMMFDWACQPFYTLILTFVFGPYFTNHVMADPVQGQALWGWANFAAGLAAALLAPFLGAVADTTGPRKPWIAGFVLIAALGSAVLWTAAPGLADPLPVLAAFAVALIAVEFASTFNSAMLADIAPKGEEGRISGSGWALGYVGGLVALVLVIGLMSAPAETGRTLLGIPPILGLDPATHEGDRAAGPLTALWLLVFVLPMLVWTPDAPRRARVAGAVGQALAELRQTVLNLPSHPRLMGFLAASACYRDGLNGLYVFGGIYAAGVLGWPILLIGVFGIVAAAAGALGAWIGGRADRAFGPRPVIVTCVLALIFVCIVVIGTGRDSLFGLPLPPGSTLPDALFFACGAVIGAAGGALQASSRTVLIREADPARMTEAFGLYALTGRAAAFVSPLLIAIATAISDSQRLGMAPVVLLFLAGLALLYWPRSAASPSASPAR